NGYAAPVPKAHGQALSLPSRPATGPAPATIPMRAAAALLRELSSKPRRHADEVAPPLVRIAVDAGIVVGKAFVRQVFNASVQTDRLVQVVVHIPMQQR